MSRLLHRFSVLLLLCSLPCAAELVVTVQRSGESNDKRLDYGNQLIKLALDKTQASHGPHRQETTPGMSLRRALTSLEEEKYPNFIFTAVYDSNLEQTPSLRAIHFPVELGLLSYRVCFYAEALKDSIAKAFEPAHFRDFIHGQGRGWTDVAILRHNGFKVLEVPDYPSLFRMVAAQRFDILCRGAHEIYDEYLANRRAGLTIEEAHGFFYPMPVFFVHHADDIEVAQRLEKGLHLAHADGSLMALLWEHYGEGLASLNLHQRHFVQLKNPFIEDNTPEWLKYVINPKKDLQGKMTKESSKH